MNWNEIIDNYVRWIKDNTSIRSVRDGASCEITTPFLDSRNDHLQIYVIKEGDRLTLTDDGQTIHDLFTSGVEINSPKRKEILKTILNGLGVHLVERDGTMGKDSLYVTANIGNVGQQKHRLLQAILAVNDMNVLSQENVVSLFKEDVELYLKSKELFHTKDVKITGKSGFDHNIDFIVSASRSHPERLIKTMSKPAKDPILATLFAFSDIGQVREQTTRNFIIYNDMTEVPSEEVIGAIGNYGITGIPWSKKERCLEEFALN